ncbi:hypothetical protein [Rickettsia bellii]|uniref:Uncharacterized protein n=1 Tax=Rickettsia bellii str. RML Mogi TaxID=1359194 RepID=A0A0F3QJC2_RICBE|nr:hypothetical protein [Rickettsia bellii]KJV91534.1 hypothetical protein RBEMOGI_0140 [Rickettsia bellii str. RML Mogi]
MLNQINHTSKAILFLLPPYNTKSEKISYDTNLSCKKSNLTLIKIIKAKNYYDYKAFVTLIYTVIKHPDKPIIVIIDEDILNTVENTIMWAVLGTLITTKLIIVATYERDQSNIKLIELTKDENRFLEFSAYCFKTYYYINWEKKIKKIKANARKNNNSIIRAKELKLSE